MERFKEGVDNTMPIIMLISILLMNILLVTGIMKLFFDWDPTIIAGVIAFVGAIIGGTITLVGVNQTIQSNKELAFKSNVPRILTNIEETELRLVEAYNIALKSTTHGNINITFNSEVKKKEIFKLAANIDKETYINLQILVKSFADYGTSHYEYYTLEKMDEISWYIDNHEQYTDDFKGISDKNEEVLNDYKASTGQTLSNFRCHLQKKREHYLDQL